MNDTSRMAALLGALRREMNGAVAESMQRGEGGYGLNYGVSIPTIRRIAAQAGTDHAFARYLYRQDVRELRMAALTIADPRAVTPADCGEWFSGRMPEELCEELALRLLSRCDGAVLDELIDGWLADGSARRRYTALMALARAPQDRFSPQRALARIPAALAAGPDDLHLARAAAVFVAAVGENRAAEVEAMCAALPDGPAAGYLRDELAWMLPGRR